MITAANEVALTKRIDELAFKAETFEEERILTDIYNAIASGDVVKFRVKTKRGIVADFKYGPVVVEEDDGVL